MENAKLGFPLLERDKDNISDSCIEIILKIIVPCIENKISSLDAHITLNKKGLKNTVKVSPFTVFQFVNKVGNFGRISSKKPRRQKTRTPIK